MIKTEENILTHWKYQLCFDMIDAYESGVKEHPQIEMKKFINSMQEEHIKIEILEYEPVPIGDCWLFLVKCSTPWLSRKLPSYISHQGFGNDKEGKYK
jgi:hypothetical protein